LINNKIQLFYYLYKRNLIKNKRIIMKRKAQRKLEKGIDKNCSYYKTFNSPTTTIITTIIINNQKKNI
jgi:hypothetical protein